MPRKVQQSKSARKKRRGKMKGLPSQLWYTPEQYDLVKRAAALDRRPMTTFAILATVGYAKLLLKNATRLRELGMLGGKVENGSQE